MAETLTFENVESATPVINENSNITFTGVDSSVNNNKTTPSLVFEDVENSKGIVVDKEEEPSNFEKLEYGFDKETWVAGDALRLAKAKLQDVFDPNKTFAEYAKENEAARIAEFEKEHSKFLTGKYDGKYTTIGSAASWLSDPYYLGGYFFGRPLLANPLTSIGFNAALIGGGNVIQQLAKKGEVDWVEAGTSAAVGGAVGAVFPIGANIAKKYIPNASKKEAEKVAKWIDGKIAKNAKLTDDELIKFRNLSNTQPVKTITKELDNWATNYYSPIAKEIGKLNKLKKDIYSQTKTIRNSNKWLRDIVKDKTQKIINPRDALKMRKTGVQQIVELRSNLQASRKAFDKERERLIKRQSGKLLQYYQLEGKRLGKIIEQINATDNFAQRAYKAVMANVTKPLLGGAIGAGANVLFGEEEDFWKFVAAGAFLGATQKTIQGSKKFQIGDKQKIYKWIDSDAVKFTLQKAREFTSATTYTKLKSFGGATERIGRLLLRGVDDPMAEKSVIAQAEAMERTYLRRIDEMMKGVTANEEAQAIAIARGNVDLSKNATPKVKKLSEDIQSFIKDFKSLYNESGFFSPRDIDDYFPRQLNWDKIDADDKAAKKIIAKIYEDLGIKGRVTNKFLKDKVTPNPNYNRLKSEIAAENYLKGHKNGYNSVINANAWRDLVAESNYKTAQRKAAETELIYTPVSDHIIHQRTLNGPYKIVEEVLEKNGFLINDVRDTLGKLVSDSVKSVSFSRKFGKNGELLKPFLQEIRAKYNNSTLTDSQKAQGIKEESELIIKTIDAYFDRYGSAGRNQLKTSVGIVSMLANLNMLGRVTITSLGDLVQPWQLSANWTSALRGLRKTNLRAAFEKGEARNLNLDITDEMAKSVARSAGLEGNNIILSGGFINQFGKKDTVPRINNFVFKALGLQWLTGYARRFAYNTGVIDAQILAKRYSNEVGKAGKGSNLALRLQKQLKELYGIESNQALQIGKFKNYDEAVANNISKKYLNQAGISGANRDALIPQVSNRLLFTQSQTPWIRILGQFLSWTQAKSAQTNRLLARIENGDTRALLKTLAVIPIYGGIQQLREMAKSGEVITDPSENTAEFLAKAGQLSGMQGWIIDMFVNRTIGPGGRDPWFLFAPGFQILTQPVVAGKQALSGDTDKAMQTLAKRFLPLPEWRNWAMRLWNPPRLKGPKIDNKLLKVPFNKGGIVKRQKFSDGDSPTVINFENVESSPLNNSVKKISSTSVLENELNKQLNIDDSNIDRDSEKKLDINKTEIKPVYEDEKFLNYIKKVENAPLKLGLTNDVVHKSAEGGNDTVAFGHKLTDEEKKSNTIYGYNIKNLTKENYNDILIKDLKFAHERLIEVYGDDYLKLDNRNKQMLIDFQFNMGSGGVKKFKNFRDGLFNNNEEKIKKEYERGYTNKNKEFIKLDKRNKDFYNFFFKKKFSIGGVVSKLVSKSFVNRGKTAITSTKGTYTKANKIFDDLKKEKIHDFGSGKGVGSNEFKNKIVTSHEPFVPAEDIVKAKGKLPNYKTADEVILNDGLKSKDGIVNLNVLNVIESPADRIKVVDQIGKLLNDDGVAIITTRSAKDVINQAKKSKNAKEYLDGWLFGKGNSLTFQKGFGQKELEDYIKAILGIGFKIEKIPSKYNIKTTGILIKKLKEELL